MKQRLKKAALIGAGLLGGYVLLAAVVAVVLPLGVPPDALQPRAGDVVASTWEKVEQRFFEQRGENLYGELTLHEGSGGPPLHYHVGFDEAGEVTEGTLSLELDGKVLTYEAGQSFRIPAGVLHRPFVQPGKRAVLRGEIPRIFAACLSQMYGYLDGAGGPGPGMMLHLSMTQAYCDTHVAPLPAEKTLMFLLNPVARAAGFKSYYPERAPKRAANTDTVAATRE